VITLGELFLKDLPDYVLRASKLSGGLAGLEQAHEVYFYEQLRGLGSRRLSGHLGNQIGRRGVEGVSMRRADCRVLHHTIRAAASADPAAHWLVSTAGRSGHILARSLIQREVPFSSFANYGIGHHFMIQQSPYCNRHVLEISLVAARGSRESGAFRPGRARLRDLAHRFRGQPRKRSFQRRLIETAGGFAAECPINWGWRARGGISLPGVGWGLLAFADSATSRPHVLSTFLRKSLRAIGAEGLHEFTQCREWFDTVLREFVNDTLRSRVVTQSDLLDVTAVIRLTEEHYRGIRPHYRTLVAALDLALAQQLFVSPQ
jgi:hypothetical protein